LSLGVVVVVQFVDVTVDTIIPLARMFQLPKLESLRQSSSRSFSI